MSESTPGDEDATRFTPAAQGAPAQASSPPPAQGSAPPAAPDAPPPGQPRRIQVGDVLNHTYEVRRFIARGGMGEVFEGVNVNADDDRVAIKVMLPHLAADPLVQAMFAKEAKTLTRLRHPGLVQYRLLGREPVLGVTYIVTEFVEGQNLSDVLKTLDSTPKDQLTLLRRLASALGAAHELGAIHRDISPDNVLLEGGRLKDAKIIDFGIAKDLDPTSKTIVGEGFAGKLNYVAPEQLGSYERNVGPWTDVYSLALVMLAVAKKRDVDMGGSLADAFTKRATVPDLSDAPDELRPILTRMLEPDPAHRLRSMDDVLAEIAAHGHETSATGLSGATALRMQQAAAGGATIVSPAPVRAPTSPPPPPSAPQRAGSGKGALIGVAVAVLLAVAAAAWFFLVPHKVDNPEQVAQQTLATALHDVPCSWLDTTSVHAQDQKVDVALVGVSGKIDKAKGDIAATLKDAGLEVGDVDFDDVKEVAPTDCGPIDAFRKLRDYQRSRLTVTQRQYEMAKGADGKLEAAPTVEIDLNGLGDEIAMFGMEETGAITPLFTSRADLAKFQTKEPRPGVTSFELITDHKGWSGVLLLKGKGPFDPALLQKGPGEVSPSWVNRFLDAAKQQGWKSEMVWYRTVDLQPG